MINYTKCGPLSELFNTADIVVFLTPVHLVLSCLSVYAICKFVENNCSSSLYVPLDSELLEFFEPIISGAKKLCNNIYNETVP